MRILMAVVVVWMVSLGPPAWAQERYSSATLQNAAVATGNGVAMNVATFSSVGVTVTIETTATVTFEVSQDGVNWASRACTSVATTNGALVTTATATGTFQCPIAGMQYFRGRISAWTSGAVTVKATATTAPMAKFGGSSGGLASTDIDTCAEIAAIVSGETGTCGELVLSQGPSLADLVVTGSLNVPNGAAPTTDAFGEVAGDNNAWGAGRGTLQIYDGTANTWAVNVLASDAPANGECIKWNTGGTITWETCGSGSMATDTLWDVAGDLAYGTGSNTGGRLAIGTAAQLLQVNSGATAPEWTSAPSGLTSISFGSNPGDAGRVRLSNGSGEGLCWEIATPGTDKCLTLNTSDQLDFNGTINLTGSTTGSVQVNGSTSGSLKITTADATAQAITVTGAAQTSGASTLTIPDMAGTNDTFVFLAKAGALTNKTVDCTTAGNVCTIYKYMQLDLVGVSGGTAGHVWDDDPLSTTCTAASTAGTNQTRAFCTFPDSDGEYGKQLKLSLPTGYVAGTLQFRVSWKTTGTGNFRPRLQTLCYASDAASDSAYSNSTYITAAAGTSARFNQTAWTTATDTGCDAEETMAIRFSRNRTEGSDTLNATADVEFVGVRYAVAQ